MPWSLLYRMHHIADHHINEYLHHFVAARNTRASSSLGELGLVISRCRTDQLFVVSPCCWASVKLVDCFSLFIFVFFRFL